MVENFCFKFDDPNYGGLSEIVRINRQTDRQTDRQTTNAGKNPKPANAVGAGKNSCYYC